MIGAAEKFTDADKFMEFDNVSFVDRHSHVHTEETHGIRKLFVRDCYRDLSQIIMETTQCNTVITGTPGVGKTSFRNYLILRLIKHYMTEKDDFSIVVDLSPKAIGGVAIQVFEAKVSENGVIDWNAWKCSSDPYPMKRNSWYLLDVSGGKSTDGYFGDDHRTVMFTSPTASAWHELRKQNTILRYLPTWSYEEADSLREGIELGEETFLKRWKNYKGVARALFATEEGYNDYECSVNNSFQNENIRKAFDSLENDDRSFAMKHLIFYFEVENMYKDARLQWGSDYLRDKAMEKYSAAISHEITTILDDLDKCTPGGLKGMMLEPLALKLLCTCNLKFDCTALCGRGSIFPGPTFPALGLKGNLDDTEFLKELQEQMKMKDGAESVMLVPSNHYYPAIDAAIVMTIGTKRRKKRFCYLLQVTISKHHPVQGDGASDRLQQIVELVGGVTECLLAFVLPNNNVYRDFEVQTVPECDGKMLRQCKIAISKRKKRTFQEAKE